MATNTGMSALSSIGISVPGASGNFGAGDLQNQAAAETEEEKKRRLALQQQQRLMGTGSAALASAFGGFTGAGSVGSSMRKYGL